MKRLLFLLTLALYGYGAMELHEWVRVPQVVMHLLEHHSDLGHHDAEDSQHGHEGEHEHEPFSADCHGELCACSGMIALPMDERTLIVSGLPLTTTLGAAERPLASGAFTGAVWIPPKA